MTRRELHLENVRLADENKQLRAWLTELIVVISSRDDLWAFGVAEIERRWPVAA